MSRRRNLGVDLCHRVDRPAEPVQSLCPPPVERLDRERNQAPTGKSPRGIATVFSVSSPSRRCAVPISCGVQVSGALRMRDHDVTVDEGI